MAACCAFPVTSYLELTWEAVRLTPSSTTSYPFFNLHDRFVSTKKTKHGCMPASNAPRGVLVTLAMGSYEQGKPHNPMDDCHEGYQTERTICSCKSLHCGSREGVLPTGPLNPGSKSQNIHLNTFISKFVRRYCVCFIHFDACRESVHPHSKHCTLSPGTADMSQQSYTSTMAHELMQRLGIGYKVLHRKLL